MTFTLSQIVGVILLHFIFDFVLQSHWMASNKSKNNTALFCHVSVYTIGLCLIGMMFGEDNLIGVYWVLGNAALHFATDYTTSRITSKLFAKDWHNFFVVVGIDQVLHYVTIFSTLWLIKN